MTWRWCQSCREFVIEISGMAHICLPRDVRDRMRHERQIALRNGVRQWRQSMARNDWFVSDTFENERGREEFDASKADGAKTEKLYVALDRVALEASTTEYLFCGYETRSELRRRHGSRCPYLVIERMKEESGTTAVRWLWR